MEDKISHRVTYSFTEYDGDKEKFGHCNVTIDSDTYLDINDKVHMDTLSSELFNNHKNITNNKIENLMVVSIEDVM